MHTHGRPQTLREEEEEEEKKEKEGKKEWQIAYCLSLLTDCPAGGDRNS